VRAAVEANRPAAVAESPAEVVLIPCAAASGGQEVEHLRAPMGAGGERALERRHGNDADLSSGFLSLDSERAVLPHVLTAKRAASPTLKPVYRNTA
jgi:hypothetical protein